MIQRSFDFYHLWHITCVLTWPIREVIIDGDFTRIVNSNPEDLLGRFSVLKSGSRDRVRRVFVGSQLPQKSSFGHTALRMLYHAPRGLSARAVEAAQFRIPAPAAIRIQHPRCCGSIGRPLSNCTPELIHQEFHGTTNASVTAT